MEAAGLGALGAVGLFDYNRKNFLYDRKLRQETEHQIMNFRIKQAELWRDDIRDIIGLTAVKMDTYLIMNTVQLGFCVMAFCEGRLSSGTPPWLISCHTLSLAGAVVYLLTSIWLAMHASVTAKSYEVRLLTQLVRLPIPTWTQLESARTYGSAFEKVESRQMFRVPFVSGSQESVQQSAGVSQQARVQSDSPPPPHSGCESSSAHPDDKPVEAADLWGLEARGDRLYELDGEARVDPSQLRHLRLVREAMQYWQTYDGFARVSMSMGTNQLITALSYYVLGYVLITNHAVVAAWFAVGLFMAIAAALIRLDMSLTSFEYCVSVLLVVTGPCLTAVCCRSWSLLTPDEIASADHVLIDMLMPIAFCSHALWFLFLLYVCKFGEQKGGAMLPVGFRSVMYMDIFGWIRQKQKTLQHRTSLQQDDAGRGATPCAVDHPRSFATLDGNLEPPPRPTPGLGPAVQSVRYDSTGRPVPARPEDLPGAAEPIENYGVSEKDFVPTTFVPRVKEDDHYFSAVQPSSRPGLVPWRIFCMITVMLSLLWCLVGASHACASFSDLTFRVRMPLLEDKLGPLMDPDGVLSDDQASLAQVTALGGGEHITTHWPQHIVRARGLSCAAERDGAGDAWFVVSTRFSLLSARLPASHELNAQSSVNFDSAPLCGAVEGESLQDVAVRCGAANRSCHALVLHRQGQQLSTCPLQEADGRPASSDTDKFAGSVASSWLQEANLVEDLAQEELFHIAVAGNGNGSNLRAYAQTSSHRIVEMEVSPGADSSRSKWLPSRVLHGGGSQSTAGISEGGLNTVGSDGRYLMVMHPKEQLLELVDIRSGANTLTTQKWKLPQEAPQWIGACSAGDSLYLLSGDHKPQLWRFPMPSHIHSDTFVATNQPIVGVVQATPAEHKTASLRGAARTPTSLAGPPSVAMVTSAPWPDVEMVQMVKSQDGTKASAILAPPSSPWLETELLPVPSMQTESARQADGTRVGVGRRGLGVSSIASS